MGDLTAQILRERVHYEPETGVFTWKPHPGSANAHRAWDKQWAGKEVAVEHRESKETAGRIDTMFRVYGRYYMAGRLAWLWMTGRWPVHQIDHIDRDPTNNRWSNLREAEHSQNQMNKGPMKNNLLGIKGVCFHQDRAGSKKYRAQIKIPGERRVKHIGWYATADEASTAYQREARRLHGEFYFGNICNGPLDCAPVLVMEK